MEEEEENEGVWGRANGRRIVKDDRQAEESWKGKGKRVKNRREER